MNKFTNNAITGILIVLLLVLGQQRADAQVANPAPYSANTLVNYVRTWNVTAPIQNSDTVKAKPLSDAKQVTRYVDGLARTIETVAKQASPLRHDIVVPSMYDSFSRQQFNYLPFVADSVRTGDVVNDGDFKLDPFQQDSAFNKAQFSGETYYYGQILYESSPLNRPQKTFSPGNSWMGSKGGGSEKSRQQQYFFNTNSDSVRVWTIGSAIGSLPSTTGIYVPGQLSKTIITDEGGHQVIQYIDMAGAVVLTKKQVVSSPGTGHKGWICTYYVYDSLQNLRSVLQPKLVELLNGSWTVTQTLSNELCFRYEYDARRRVIVKKTPGAGEMWAVYDARDRIVMNQDSALRAQGKWLVTVYDSENRPYQSGLLTDANNRAYHQNLAYNSTAYPSTSSNYELLSQQYLDDYSWVSSTAPSLGSSIDASRISSAAIFITGYNASPVYAQQIVQSKLTRGMVTGTKVKVVGTSSTYLYSVSFYDDHQRTIQVQSINVTGGKDITTFQYSFSGEALRSYTQHQKSGSNSQNHTYLAKMDYDAMGRPIHLWGNIDSASSDQLIDSLHYNELGQLQKKYLGKAVDSLTFDYNIRGWLTGINKAYAGGGTANYFGMELAYDKTTSVTGATYSNPAYNGNIAGAIWKTIGDTTKRKYDFTYDIADRLTSGNFVQNTGSGWNNSTVDYTVSGLSYDANGNMLTMSQRGFKVGGSAVIDSLVYNYLNSNASNRLMGVTDAANDTASTLGDFHYKGSKQSSDYSYDGNGSLLSDNNRGINSITYNYLSLMQLIDVKSKGTIQYVYDASGNRLQKITVDSTQNPVKTITTTYIGAFVYQQDTLQFVQHPEGRIRWAYHKYTTGSTAYKFEYDFFERDHLGNTRMVLTQQKDTTQYMATMEAAFRSTENALFYNIPATCVVKPSGYPTDGTTSPNDSVARVNGSGQKMGPAIILKVMAGDIVSIGCKSYYTSQTGTGTNPSFNDVLNSLASGVQSVTGGAEGTTAQLTGSGAPLFNALTSFMNANNPTVAGKPRAWLNWMLMDNQLKYDSTFPQSGAVPVSNYSAGTLGTPAHSSIQITKSGYLFIYVNNETQGWDVFFDNLSVQVYSGPLLEENHYYPYGLGMAAISSKALKTNYIENKYRYNQGTELQSKEFSDGSGLEMYATGLRGYDQQIGRFHQIDPYAEKYVSTTTFSYGGGNPLLYNDPTGGTKVRYGRITGVEFADGGTGGGGGGPTDATDLGGGGDMVSQEADQWQDGQEAASAAVIAQANAAWQQGDQGDDNPDVPTTTLQNVLNSMSGNSATVLTNNDDGTFSSTTVNDVAKLSIFSVEAETESESGEKFYIHFMAEVAQNTLGQITDIFAPTAWPEPGNMQTVNKNGVSSTVVSVVGPVTMEILSPLPWYSATVAWEAYIAVKKTFISKSGQVSDTGSYGHIMIDRKTFYGDGY